MGIIQKKVTPEFRKWVGYCEKNRKDHLGTYDNPEHFKNNAGDGNYTVFADLYRQKTGINVQGQPWCDSFVDTVLIHLFGVEAARALLGGFPPTPPPLPVFIKKWAAITTRLRRETRSFSTTEPGFITPDMCIKWKTA